MRLVVAALVLGFGMIACGSDHSSGPMGSGVVGAACHSNGDCASRCVTDGFPGGMCTVECNSDADCPGGTACINEKGGICEVLCGGNADCASFGGGWTCEHRDRKGADGAIAVCHG